MRFIQLYEDFKYKYKISYFVPGPVPMSLMTLEILLFMCNNTKSRGKLQKNYKDELCNLIENSLENPEESEEMGLDTPQGILDLIKNQYHDGAYTKEESSRSYFTEDAIEGFDNLLPIIWD